MTAETASTSELIASLLGRETTADTVREVQARLAKIVLPWTRNRHIPPQFERRTGDGKLVGLVDSFLGGYGQPHRPREHGWGFKGNNPRGQGACTSGIVDVVLPRGKRREPSEEDHKESEESAKRKAQQIVDVFLSSNFPELLLL